MEDSVVSEMLHCNDRRSYWHVVPLMKLASERASLNSTVIHTDIAK